MNAKEFNKCIRLIKAGNNQGIERIYNCYYEKLKLTIDLEVKNKDITEDIASNVIINIFSNAQNYKYIKKPNAWMYKATKFAIINYKKIIKKYVFTELIDEVYPTKDKDITFKILVKQAIEQLPQRQKEIVLIHYIYGSNIRETAKIIGLSLSTVTLDTNKTYRWSGSSYVEISASLALGETSRTAYRGDRGKIAYDHSQVRGNPHNTSKSEVGLGNVANERQYSAQNMQPYPLGFASADNDFSWGVNIGSPLRVWNEASGGSIGFRKNCPANGKLSIVVDGKVYVDEGQKELATLDSPTFTGSPKVPTPSQSSNDNTVANTAWVKNILNEGGIALYRHRILLSGSNTSVSNAFTLGLIEVYTKSSQPITTVAGVAAALGITGNMELVPVSGCAENGSNHTVLCTEAWVSPSSITLHGMYFGYSSGNGIIERVSTTVTSVSDKVSLVQ